MNPASGRRTVLTGLMAAIGWTLTPIRPRRALAALRAAPDAGQDDGAAVRPKTGDVLVRAGDDSRTPLTPAGIPVAGGYVEAWAMDPGDKTVRSGSRLNQLLLLRFDPDSLSAETRARSAEGVVAYTSICTHNGCDIDTWLAAQQRLYCSCHESIFEPKDGGRVVDGPAPRPLPALPLTVVDGVLVVAKPFTTPVGFEKG